MTFDINLIYLNMEQLIVMEFQVRVFLFLTSTDLTTNYTCILAKIVVC